MGRCPPLLTKLAMPWAPTWTLEDPNASLVLYTNGAVWLLWSWRHGISFPIGDIRNDLYLTLEKGDFERGGKSVQKNIEVTMYVLYADGEILKVRFASQFGMKANPEIIFVTLWNLSRDPFSSGRPPSNDCMYILLCREETLQYALIMTSSVIQPV